MKTKILSKIAVFLVVTASQLYAGETIHVGLGGGFTYNTIQDGITAANHGDTVLVHNGIYTGPGNRDISLQGKEILLKSVNGAKNCIIDVAASNAEWHNAFSLTSGETNATVIDGFTITGGYTYQGGGIYIEGSSPTIQNSVFTGNTGGWGGAIAIKNSNAIIHNSLIYENTGWDAAGGIISGGGNIDISNSTIARNNSARGGGIYGTNGTINVIDSILWGNIVDYDGSQIYLDDSTMDIDYSDVESGELGVDTFGSGILNWGVNNIVVDPEFATGPLGNYYLSHTASGQPVDSSCIDVGSDLAANLEMDIYTTRTDNLCDRGIVDMGYHYIPEPYSLLLLIFGGIMAHKRRKSLE